MKNSFLSKHRHLTAKQRFNRRRRLMLNIDSSFGKHVYGIMTVATNISPSTKCHPLIPSVYSEQSVYGTKLGLVVVWLQEKFNMMQMILIHEGDMVRTSFAYHKDYKFDMAAIVVRFTEIVHTVYDHVE